MSSDSASVSGPYLMVVVSDTNLTEASWSASWWYPVPLPPLPPPMATLVEPEMEFECEWLWGWASEPLLLPVRAIDPIKRSNSDCFFSGRIRRAITQRISRKREKPMVRFNTQEGRAQKAVSNKNGIVLHKIQDKKGLVMVKKNCCTVHPCNPC